MGKRSLNYNYDIQQKHTYTNDAKSVEDAWIETEGGTGNGTLLMFRDSFGNTLIPLIADQFKQAWFTKEVPYGLESLMEQYHPDTIVFEKVERNLSEYINMPPIISALKVDVPKITEATLDDDNTQASKTMLREDSPQATETRREGKTGKSTEATTTISMEALDYDFNYYKISGSIAESLLGNETDIIVGMNGTYYKAYHIGSNDYEIYIKKESITTYPVEIEVLIKDQETYQVVQTKKITQGE